MTWHGARWRNRRLVGGCRTTAPVIHARAITVIGGQPLAAGRHQIMTQHTRRSSARTFALAFAALLLPATLAAQERAVTERQPAAASSNAPATAVPQHAGTTGTTTAAPVVVGAPRLAPAGIQRVATPLPVLGDGQDDPHLGVGQNLALMGAGGAAVIVGLLIGGDSGTIIAVSGGVIALVGLYRYLR
jgi:hypothetical protein